MMNSARRLFTAVGLAVTMTTALAGLATPAAALGVFSQPKYAAIVLDANSGEVLYAKRADALRFPASITKIMTLYLTFEALATGRLSMHDTVTISPHAYSMAPSKVSTHAGETLSVEEAIQAVTVHSANDVAVALAEKVGGSESRFAQLMTLRARELGMTHSYFVNASGLPDSRQIVTARDISILARAVMRDYPQYYAYFGERSFDFHGKVLINHNHLLQKMPGVDGLKTGYTNAAGFNLAASAVRGGHRLITVVLGGPSTAARDENVEELLDAGFNVINRRAAGQRMTIASLISEPDDMSGPLERPPIEEGSADQAGLQVEVQPQVRTMPVMAAAQALSEEPKRETARAEREAAQAEKTAAADCAPTRHDRRHHRHVETKACKAALAKAETRKAKLHRDETEQAAAAPCPTAHGRHHRHAAACHADEAQVARADKSEKHKDGGYMIQVGAYKNHSLAKDQLDKIASMVDGRGQVEHAGGNYRARFLGLSQHDAKAACRTLSAHGHPCMVLGAS
ncbi:D-alanyl-D-alanine carboxypeptidase [Caulobacter sp. S45]|jgi:D-alanyl-D-alanine carboxypeptidase|uniref:D-alanyl-D-alanine carboxypeptidase n=1 Tax=Caulobacter sp. S45 TaxID=1641861 RepID=UPI00131E3150|nr:D-alanyl-D-alanine carboxypeptidase [Caulobacter sp. S45]